MVTVAATQEERAPKMAPHGPAADLVRLMTPADYASAHRHLFPSEVSLRWFMRAHRGRLLEAAALMMIRGRLMVDPDPFGAVYVAVAQEMAAAT
jgi:hypothetical protein